MLFAAAAKISEFATPKFYKRDNMITVEEANAIILSHAMPLETEWAPIATAVGRILAEDLVADRDFPPFDRVSMDGIAIRHASFAAGQFHFPIEGVAAAGAPQVALNDATACLEVMTGAMLPLHTDTVIRYEDLTIENGEARLSVTEVKAGQNIHRQGLDRHKGEVIVPSGRLISAAEIGLAATLGKSMLRVRRIPKVAVVVNGNELVGIGEEPLPYQIRQSNNYALRALMSRWGVQADMEYLPDNEDIIALQLRRMLDQYEVVVLCGGVSKGKFDFLPTSLEKLGVTRLFHRVSQRPGQPFWFGVHPDLNRVIFAFPGNPVSAFMNTIRYFQPWLYASSGLTAAPVVHAVLAEEVTFKPDLTYFMQVKVHSNTDGRLVATPLQGKGSGDLANLTDADAFLELPRGKEVYQAGEVFRLWGYR